MKLASNIEEFIMDVEDIVDVLTGVEKKSITVNSKNFKIGLEKFLNEKVHPEVHFHIDRIMSDEVNPRFTFKLKIEFIPNLSMNLNYEEDSSERDLIKYVRRLVMVLNQTFQKFMIQYEKYKSRIGEEDNFDTYLPMLSTLCRHLADCKINLWGTQHEDEWRKRVYNQYVEVYDPLGQKALGPYSTKVADIFSDLSCTDALLTKARTLDFVAVMLWTILEIPESEGDKLNLKTMKWMNATKYMNDIVSAEDKYSKNIFSQVPRLVDGKTDYSILGPLVGSIQNELNNVTAATDSFFKVTDNSTLQKQIFRLCFQCLQLIQVVYSYAHSDMYTEILTNEINIKSTSDYPGVKELQLWEEKKEEIIENNKEDDEDTRYSFLEEYFYSPIFRLAEADFQELYENHNRDRKKSKICHQYEVDQ